MADCSVDVVSVAVRDGARDRESDDSTVDDPLADRCWLGERVTDVVRTSEDVSVP